MTQAQAKTGAVVTKAKTTPSFVEFVIIVSMMMSLTALSIDAMLPALPQIGRDLSVATPNDRQLVVSLFFLGLAVGQLFFGPLSDKTGRKPAIYAGFAIYLLGSLTALFSGSFAILLAGRILQGIGISSPRAVTLALVRDRYEGRIMARVMSFVMTIFILVPMVAPSLGQALLNLAGWRSIFGGFIFIALFTLLWFSLRIPESLAPENRSPFSLGQIGRAVRTFASFRLSVGYTVIAGFVSGAQLGYLNSSQQILQEQYGLGERFPIYFAVIALSIGLASLSNSRLVMTVGMRFLIRVALTSMFVLGIAALGLALLTGGQPPLWSLMAYLMLTFFSIGILFGNMNALAMQPLGHLAGIGAAIIGSFSTLLAMLIGLIIGRSYDGTVIPLILGMVIGSGLSLLIVRWAESGTSEA